MKRVLVTGAGGFLGSALVKRLRAENNYVVGLGRSDPRFEPSQASEFHKADLRVPVSCIPFFERVEDVYQCAGDTGGLGYLENHDNDADLLRNNLLINLNVLDAARHYGVRRVLFVSTGCVYPENAPVRVKEEDASLGHPMNEFGFASLACERLYAAYGRNYNLQTRIARIHSTYGPNCIWQGGKERAPAALCRKIALAKDGDAIEIWGDGRQTRSFMYVDDAVEGMVRLMNSDCALPVNIGSTELVSINQLAWWIMEISRKKLDLKHIDGPVGASGRCSDNALLRWITEWEPSILLRDGLPKLYQWVEERVVLTNQLKRVV